MARRGLVLVPAATRVCAYRAGNGAVSDELFGLSARECDRPDFLVARVLGDFRTIGYWLGYGHRSIRARLLIGMIKVGSSRNPRIGIADTSRT
jgi:hypothetical protein